MKAQIFNIVRELLRGSPGIRRGVKVFVVVGGLALVGVGGLTAGLAYVAFDQLQGFWGSPAKEKIVASASEQAGSFWQMVEAPACQNELQGFLKPQVWLVEGIDTQWEKTVDTCFPALKLGLLQAED